jgi:hypothetical protein
MTWAVPEFLEQVVDSLNNQGYRVDALGDPRPLGEHGGAWRCDLHSPEEAMPESVVLKQTGEGWPWRWQDWSCQYFLSDLAGTRGLGPEFFAADAEVGFYLIEDLGLGTDLGLAMMRPDSRGRLAAGLMACSLAGLHAGTFGREHMFSLLRQRLPGAAPERQVEQEAWRAGVDRALEELKPGLAGALADGLAGIQEEMSAPAEFLCLTHGDWNANSVWYGDAGPRLLDFRNGAFRHALLDLAAWEWRCLGHPAAADSLWREYKGELERLGADRGERFNLAYSRARAWMALRHFADGEHTPDVQTLLVLASEEKELVQLQDVASLL